jgi:hypothetical protein
MNSLTTYPSSQDIIEETRAERSMEAMHMCHCLQPILIIIRYRIVRTLRLDTDFERIDRFSDVDDDRTTFEPEPTTALTRMRSPEFQRRAALN